MLAITFTSVVLAIHVMAVVVAFGIVFTYPVLVPWLRRAHPETMPAVHAGQERVVKMVITPAMVVVLAAGVYLASKLDVWSESWVSIPLLILIILFGLSGAFFAPNERKLSELARHDLDGGGQLGDEYGVLFDRVARVGQIAALLVLVAIFFMVVQP